MNNGSQQPTSPDERDRVVRRDSKGRFDEAGQPVDRERNEPAKPDAEEDRND